MEVTVDSLEELLGSFGTGCAATKKGDSTDLGSKCASAEVSLASFGSRGSLSVVASGFRRAGLDSEISKESSPDSVDIATRVNWTSRLLVDIPLARRVMAVVVAFGEKRNMKVEAQLDFDAPAVQRLNPIT